MKKSILIFCIVLTTLSLMAFGFINRTDPPTDLEETSSMVSAFDTQVINDKAGPVFFYDVYSKYMRTITNEDMGSVRPMDDFFYDVDSRYMRTITKEDLDKVRSMNDLLPEEQIESIVSFHSVRITFLDDNYESIISETGEGDVFNAAQVKLLQSAAYSTNILVRAEYQEMNEYSGQLQNNYTTPHLTVVPEKEAVYISGKDALITYLKENSKEQTTIVTKGKLQPGKVHFTVTRNGTISNVKLSSTSGYPSIDKTMIELITKAPGKWEPAANSSGEKVDQEFVFSFGIIGC